ncbi:MAG: methyltransferase dimerization domain-containing protein [Acidobacteriota bacterium]
MLGHQLTDALKAGVEIGLFNALGDGTQSAAQIASRAGVAERAMRILCISLLARGLLDKQGDLCCHTPTSAVFLDPRSPATMAPALPFLMTDKMLLSSRLMTEAIPPNRTALTEPSPGKKLPNGSPSPKPCNP